MVSLLHRATINQQRKLVKGKSVIFKSVIFCAPSLLHPASHEIQLSPPSSVRIRCYFHRRLARTDAIVVAFAVQTGSERRVIITRRASRSEIGSVGAPHLYTLGQYSRPLPTTRVLPPPPPRGTTKRINSSWAGDDDRKKGGTKSYEADPRTTVN